MTAQTISGKIDTSKLVKAASREAFRDRVPRPKRIEDKRFKKPRHGHKVDE